MLLLQQTHIERHVDLTQKQFGCIADHHNLLVQILVNEIIEGSCLKKLVSHADNASQRRYELVCDWRHQQIGGFVLLLHSSDLNLFCRVTKSSYLALCRIVKQLLARNRNSLVRLTFLTQFDFQVIGLVKDALIR